MQLHLPLKNKNQQYKQTPLTINFESSIKKNW